MYQAADLELWQGREDSEDGAAGRRWYQQLSSDLAGPQCVALLGLASDCGVRRNQGRAGAAAGPAALRRALAGLAWHHPGVVCDRGDVMVEDDLEAGQLLYAQQFAAALAGEAFVVGLGGGHEIAWGSFLGCREFMLARGLEGALGILNFDAHFDLRLPAPAASSGTPFLQAAQYCQEREQPFHYTCLGVARQANTRALFQRAQDLDVRYLLDVDYSTEAAVDCLRPMLAEVDYLYVTCCLDVFPACVAPGVSAPSSLGVPVGEILRLLPAIAALCREYGVQWLAADVAELAPGLDSDRRTERLAARLVDELVAARYAI